MASGASPPAKRKRPRSALTVGADEDNNPTTVQGYAESSASRQDKIDNESGRGSGEPADHDASSDSSEEEVSKPEYLNQLVNQEDYTSLSSIRTIFAQRYSEVKIYVDDMNREPQKVLIYNFHGVEKYEVDYNDNLIIITSEMDKKWPSPAPSYEKTPDCYDEEKHDCLQYMLRIFQVVRERIIYDRKQSQWICNKGAVPGSSSATEESHTSQEKERHSDKTANRQGNKAKKKNPVLKNTLIKYGFLYHAISARIITALESQMRNSCGRDTISMLLRCACAIAFGPRYEEEKGVFVYQVGTSDYPFEGFPVSSIDEFELTANDKPEDVESPVPKATIPLPLELPGFESPTNVSRSYLTSEGNKSSGQESTKSFGKGYIYPDIIVACKSGHDAKFLLLIAVKSNASILQSKAQVLRQGVGALVGQKQVFTLAVSPTRGALLKICRNDNDAQFTFNEEQYRLQEKKGVDQVYNGEDWFKMFIDLIRVLDSAVENIQAS